MQQWIDKNLKLECYKVLSGDGILLLVAQKKREILKNDLKVNEENIVTHQKLRHDDALVHTEALLNYFKQDDESIPAEKMMLRNLRSKIRQRVN